jgi:hypothetical protein
MGSKGSTKGVCIKTTAERIRLLSRSKNWEKNGIAESVMI